MAGGSGNERSRLCLLIEYVACGFAISFKRLSVFYMCAWAGREATVYVQCYLSLSISPQVRHPTMKSSKARPYLSFPDST